MSPNPSGKLEDLVVVVVMEEGQAHLTMEAKTQD